MIFCNEAVIFTSIICANILRKNVFLEIFFKIMIQKLALGVEYDGLLYCGWQKQKNMPSVQKYIERALKKITSEKITIYCAGRTDSGVHALGQVIHFETNIQRSWAAWVFGINHYLPSSICVHWMSLVKQDFHARFSAISRRYCYIIYNDRVRSAVLFGKTWHYGKFLDIYKMFTAGQYLLGRNDFSSFCASGSQSYSMYREIYYVDVKRKGKCVIIDIKANSFLYHMVRNIVGSLVEIGCGKRPISWMLTILKSNNRKLAGITAPAHGLYLIEVEYPLYFKIPSFFSKKFWE